MAALDILLVAVITIYIVDLSGFTDTWLTFLSNYRGRKVTELKPFSCSLCMVWWVCLIFSLLTGSFSIPIVAYIAMLSMLSAPIGQLMLLLREGILKLVNLMMDRI